MKIIRPAIRRVLNALDYEVVKLSRYHQSLGMPNDLQNVEIIKATADYTMTPPEAGSAKVCLSPRHKVRLEG